MRRFVQRGTQPPPELVLQEHCLDLLACQPTALAAGLVGTDDADWICANAIDEQKCEKKKQKPDASAFGCHAVRLSGGELHMNHSITVLMTWTTYGTWLPGDGRGWRNRTDGPQIPQGLLEEWCRQRLTGDVVLLQPHDRTAVEAACQSHCDVRTWKLLAVNARTNHVHAVVVVDMAPKKALDQLKANCTRALRVQNTPLIRDRTWTRGGDCEILETENAVNLAVKYVLDGQD